MNKIVVIYHRSDYDGIFCREIAKKHFGISAFYIGWSYGDRLPQVADTDSLYILDLSIEGLMDHPNLIWIDHHKTAIEKYGKKPGIQIDGVAACRLAWQYWFHDEKENDCVEGDAAPYLVKSNYVERLLREPYSVRLAGEYDVWDKRDKNTDTFQLGLKAQKLSEANWNSLLSYTQQGQFLRLDIIQKGKAIREYKMIHDAEAIEKYGFDHYWQGINFLCLNTALCNSDSFAAGVKEEHDALFAYRFDGRKYIVSLYGLDHKPDIDLSVIALKYGGGGHKHACGFVSLISPFLLL